MVPLRYPCFQEEGLLDGSNRIDTPPHKSGGFYHSSTGTDDLKRVGFTQVSRCLKSGLPDPTEILRCVNISIVMFSAFRARPVSNVEGLLATDVSTFRTALRRREPLVGNDERPPVPLAFITQSAHNLTPPGLSDVTSKTPVLLHRLHRKVLNHDHVPIFDETGRQLLDKVLTAVLNALVDLRHTFFLPHSVVRSFLLSRKLLLLSTEPLIFVFEPAWIPDFFAG